MWPRRMGPRGHGSIGEHGVVDIGTIEMRRKAHGFSKKRLCQVAEVDRGTYGRLTKLPGSGRADTFKKLDAALRALIEVKEGRADG